MKLPADYTKLTRAERSDVREQYEDEQGGDCWYCALPLYEEPPKPSIDWRYFPPGFTKNPVHLHHDHENGMTVGAVHAYCTAVLWQYEGR